MSAISFDSGSPPRATRPDREKAGLPFLLDMGVLLTSEGKAYTFGPGAGFLNSNLAVVPIEYASNDKLGLFKGKRKRRTGALPRLAYSCNVPVGIVRWRWHFQQIADRWRHTRGDIHVFSFVTAREGERRGLMAPLGGDALRDVVHGAWWHDDLPSMVSKYPG